MFCTVDKLDKGVVFLLFRRQSLPLPQLVPPLNNQTPLERTEKVREKIKEPRESREKNNIRPKEQRDKEKVLKTKEKEEKKEKKASPPPPPQKPEKRAAVTERGKMKEEKRGGGQEKKTERSVKPQLPKVKAEPPPKKRRMWLKEVPSSSDSSASEDDSEYTLNVYAYICDKLTEIILNKKCKCFHLSLRYL